MDGMDIPVIPMTSASSNTHPSTKVPTENQQQPQVTHKTYYKGVKGHHIKKDQKKKQKSGSDISKKR